MNNEDLQAIINLRQYLVSEYDKLGTGANNTIGQTETTVVAAVLENAVKSLDFVLTDKVNFG